MKRLIKGVLGGKKKKVCMILGRHQAFVAEEGSRERRSARLVQGHVWGVLGGPAPTSLCRAAAGFVTLQSKLPG